MNHSRSDLVVGLSIMNKKLEGGRTTDKRKNYKISGKRETKHGGAGDRKAGEGSFRNIFRCLIGKCG